MRPARWQAGHLTFVSRRLSAVGSKRISQFFDSAGEPRSRVIPLVDSTWVFLLLPFYIVLSYTCQLFFSKMREIFSLHRIWISEDLPASSVDHRRFPTTSEDFPTTSDDNRRSRKIFDDFKTGRATISKGFPSNLEHFKDFRRCSDDFSNVKKLLKFYLLGF